VWHTEYLKYRSFGKEKEGWVANMQAFQLRIQGLSYTYPGENKAALRDVSLEVNSRDLVHLWGASGTGKSTLLKLAVRLLVPPKGCIFFNGRDIVELPIKMLRSQVKLMLTPPAFFDLTVKENLEMVSRGHASGLRRAFSALRLPWAYLEKKASELSYGEQQRVNLVRVLLTGPRLLLLDEPTQGMDAALVEDVFVFLRELCEKDGLGVLLAAHSNAPGDIASDKTYRRVELQGLSQP
jgi:ABC-type multidrug transport system ATPase subunit